MAGWPPEKNASFTWYFFIRDADGDPVVGATALDVERSIDGGAFADVAGAEVDEGEGLYSCPITAAEMNGDVIALICKTSTAGAKTAAQVIYTSTRQIDDLAFPATSGRSIQVETDGMIHADLKEWLGVAMNALVSGRVDASVGAMAAAVVTAAAVATDAITAAKIAAGAIGSSEAPNLDAAVSSRAAASVLGALADAAADGDPTIGDTAMAYIKQLINTLEGSVGLPSFPAEAAPANNVSMVEVLRAIHDDVTGIAGASMRGTDNAVVPADLGFPEQNQALPNIEFLMVLSTDHVTPATGLTVTGQRSIDGGAFGAVSGTIAEVGSGIYQFDALAADMNGGIITFRFSAGTADDTFITIKTRP